MLILKGNWYFEKAGVVLALAVLLSTLACGPARGAEGARTPETVAAEFYGWYLDALAADQDPLSDRHARFTGYVARALTQRLIERLQHPPPPASDYFLQGRYDPARLGNMRVAPLARAKERAQVLVTLSESRPLVLTLVVEEGAWKIAQVRPAPDPESSLQQPAI